MNNYKDAKSLGWQKDVAEKTGVHPDKNWYVKNGQRALFKPDTDENESVREFEAARIAEALNIPCAKIELVEIDGHKGILSHDVKPLEPYRYTTAIRYAVEQLHDNRVDLKSKEWNDIAYISGMSLETVHDKLPASVGKSALNMMFFDCLIANSDRHGENWELELDENDEAVNLVPLFDHGKALDESVDVSKSAMLFKNNDGVETHDEVFISLASEYPEPVYKLMLKARSIPNLNAVAQKRLNAMTDIWNYIAPTKNMAIIGNFSKTQDVENLVKRFGEKISLNLNETSPSADVNKSANLFSL